MTQYALLAVVEASAAVAAASSSRNAEDRAAGALLGALQPDEIEPAVSFLSGSPRQGRIGLGYAAISAAGDVPAWPATRRR